MIKKLKENKLIKQYIHSLKAAFKIALPYILKYKYYHLVCIILMLWDIFFALSNAWFLGSITDAAVKGQFQSVLKLIPIGIVLTVAPILTTYISSMVQVKLSNGIMRDFRLHVFDHLLRLPVEITSKKHTGELISHVTNDVNGIMGLVGNGVISIFRHPLTFLGAFIYVSYLNWKLALLSIVAGPIILGISTYFSRLIRENSIKSLKIYADTSKVINETFTGLQIIRAFTLEKQFYDKYQRQENKKFNLMIANTKLQSYFSITSSSLSSIVSLAITGIGFYSVAKKMITMGDLMVFTTLLGYLISPLTGMASVWSGMQNSIASLERVQKVLDLPTDTSNLPTIIDEKLDVNSIQFRDVTFGYTEQKHVFENINIEIFNKKIIALVGPSGAGKSTFFNLLLGFYKPQKGDIYINGISVKEIDIGRLRNMFAYVPQESFLFATTIRENLSMVKPAATESEIIEAAKAANIHEFILSLPDGYDTNVGERGVLLSGGQKQRLAIARAILKDAPILLLDEATSALDSETEYLVQEALERLMEGRMTLIIAHRLSTIKNADEIIVMNEGSIIEVGSHEQLLNQRGQYYRMYNRQFLINKSEVTA